jgi:hypothetical protein
MQTIRNKREVKMNKWIKVVSVMLVLVLGAASVAYAAESSIPGGGWWSGEMIQNVGTGDATVIVSAYGTGGTYTAQATLAQNAAKNFTPSDFTGMPDGFEGAAVVSSDEPIKAIVNVTNRQAGGFGVAGGEAAAQYQGVDGSAVAKTLYFPMAKNDRFGKTTTFYIQNAGSAAATAQATFKMDDGNSYTYTTPSIQPNHMVIITPGDAGVPTSQTNRANIGSLKVTSAENLAGVVMEYVTAESPAKLLQSTRGFTESDFDSKFYAPTVKQNRFNRFTGIQVQNVEETASVDVSITLVGARGACAGQTYVRTATGLGPGESHTFNQIAGQDGQMVDNCAASATIVATGGDIVAVVSESFTSAFVGAGNQQASTTYSAFPDVATSQTVSVPMYKENRFSKYTGLMIQNVGTTQATNVVVTFIGAAGPAAGNTYSTKPQTIGAGSNIELSKVSENAGLWSGTAAPNDSTYGVTISSDQNVVSIANEAVYPGASLAQDKNNYEGFNLP